MSKPKTERRFGHFECDCDNCCQGNADMLSTHPQSTPIPPDYLPAEDSNQSAVISTKTPSGEYPCLECANLLLPTGESFPISFLQRHFRIGYSRAIKLHEALIKRRAEGPPNHRSGRNPSP